MPDKQFRPLPVIPNKKAELFWSKVDRNAPNGCWLWLAGKYRGYGSFNVTRGQRFAAHRIAYFLIKGIDPSQQLICHDCPNGDNPSCVNPDHMFLGNRRANAQDASQKGMLAFGDRNSTHIHPENVRRGERHHWFGAGMKGEKHSQAKLTEADVREIRKRVAAGETQTSLAKEFSIHASSLNLIVKRINWSHI